MSLVAANLVDCFLLTAHGYLLLRLGLSKHETFHTPFFHWFVSTGVYSSLSVFGYIVDIRFAYPPERAWVFKAGYVWTRRFSSKLVAVQLFLSAVQCGQFFYCYYKYQERNGVSYVNYFEDNCTVFEKSKSSVIYLIFVVLSSILIFLTSREMHRLSNLAGDKTKQILLVRQREMFIVISVCSITHLIKAVHQLCWVLVAFLHQQEAIDFLEDAYPYTHYLSTYSGAITLVLFNSRVRWLLISINYADREVTTQVSSLSRF
ncbi:hypothetical protein PRIPAC_88509 [Pristionchus pacificus]|uniref:Uncharacterized protein n=1 Tax=Pristionchus pacificus TaxID=54126 RepID=A0A2A6CWH4_PRIPA|nr:hypothetical protein PRIPAC_88509 [Pristionchus pacificus]|eukprot:PDM82371.1 hypothetical protein PRIPAC_36764 [Pristionchus pacificus]